MTEREAQVLIADQLGLSVVSIPNVSVPIGGWNWYEADLIYFRPKLIIRRARPRKGVDRLTPERQMKYMRIGAYKWWKRHSEEVIRRCIEDEYREDDVNAMGRCK